MALKYKSVSQAQAGIRLFEVRFTRNICYKQTASYEFSLLSDISALVYEKFFSLGALKHPNFDVSQTPLARSPRWPAALIYLLKNKWWVQSGRRERGREENMSRPREGRGGGERPESGE